VGDDLAALSCAVVGDDLASLGCHPSAAKSAPTSIPKHASNVSPSNPRNTR